MRRNAIPIHPWTITLTITALALVLIGATQAARAGSGRQPAAVLPGDAAGGPAAYNQENAQIARGANGYLVVWEDSRTNYMGTLDGVSLTGGEEGGQQLRDIYAARLDASGQLIDPIPIVVAQATWSQTRPQAAWNGQNWLVVWNTRRVAGFTSTVDVLAARVSPAGVVLDNPPIAVNTSDPVDELWPTVASDGTNWVVAWQDQGTYFELDAARIGPAGQVLDPGGVALVTPQFPDAPYNANLTFAGDTYLLVWQGDNKIKGLRFTPALQPLGGVFIIAPAGNFPRAATNGTDFFVAWQQSTEVYGARVTHAGGVLDPSGINITGSNGGYPQPDVAWDGSQWFVTWVATSDNTYVARVSPAGQLLDPSGILIAPMTRISAIEGQVGGGARLVWTDYHLGALGSYDLYSAGVSATGTPGTAAPVSLGAPAQLRPDVAANGTGYLAVFVSTTSGETRIKGQRLDANGNAIDPEPFLIMGGARTLTRPRVSWNGALYLVVWEDSSVPRGFVSGAIFGKRVSASGAVLDATPIDIAAGNAPDVAALGSTFLVVDTYEQINHQRRPQAVRVDAGGAVLGAPVYIGSSYAVRIKVEALGSRWLAAWEYHSTHDNPRSSAVASFVNADGTPAGEFVVANNGTITVKAPDIAVGANNQALISYFNRLSGDVLQGEILARRIDANGTFLDGPAGIQVTSAPNAQFNPAGVWTGSEWLVAFEDNRNVAYLDQPVSDIYGARIDDNGVVLDPNGFVVANDSIPEVQPALAANAGSYVIAFANFKWLAPYAAYRIDVQHGQAGAPPTPEATSTATATPPPATNTPAPATHTPAPATSTPAATNTPATSTPAATNTPGAATQTATVAATHTAVPGATNTPGATHTAGPPTSTPTACPMTFSDVQPSDYFAAPVAYLACQGVISGYADGTFRPYANTTRGQMVKIVVLGFGLPIQTPATPTFSDVPASQPFSAFVETAAARGIVSGYADGTFRPNANVTRGQLSKITVLTAGWAVQNPSANSFADVAPGSAFYPFVETAVCRGILSGYRCGGPGEPCDSANRPYFRQNNNATRGQIAKIVYGARTAGAGICTTGAVR